jgi:hypothetical protein
MIEVSVLGKDNKGLSQDWQLEQSLAGLPRR